MSRIGNQRKFQKAKSVDTGEDNEVSATSSESAGFLQEEQPCCSNKIGLKAVTTAKDVVSDEVLSVSQNVKVVTVEDVVPDEALPVSQDIRVVTAVEDMRL